VCSIVDKKKTNNKYADNPVLLKEFGGDNISKRT
jgi:hypothetical protein